MTIKVASARIGENGRATCYNLFKDCVYNWIAIA